MSRYEFTITIVGQGETSDEAWGDACESFSLDNGTPPEDFVVEEEEEE